MKWISRLMVALALLFAAPAFATVTSPTTTQIDTADGVTTAFAYNFIVPYQPDGVTPAVTVTTVVNGTVTVLTPAQYTITGVGNATGGTVTPSGSTLPAGAQVIITRAYQYVQDTAVPNTGFYPHTVEQVADTLEYQIQQLQNNFIANSGVLSFNTRTGNVTLTPADVNGVYGSNPANQVLATPNGSAGVPSLRSAVAADINYQQNGTGSQARTLQDWIADKMVDSAEFMTPAQLADVEAGTETQDVTAAVQAWLLACETEQRPCRPIPGVYKISGPIVFEQAGELATGLTVMSESPGNVVFDSSYTGGVPFSVQASGGTSGNPISSVYAVLDGVALRCNYAGPCLQIGKPDGSDLINEATIWRVTIQNFNAGALSTAAQFNNTYSGYYFMNGSTAAQIGQIATFNNTVGAGGLTQGSGYSNGTHTNVPLTNVSSSGFNATANIVVSGGLVTSVTINTPGIVYMPGDTLTATQAAMGGSGSGFQTTVATTNNTQNDIFRLTNSSFGRFFLGGSEGYNWVHLTSGFSYGNTFIGSDCEIIINCVLNDSNAARQNTWIGGRFAYAAYGIIDTAGGTDQLFINPNTQLAVGTTFVSPGSSANAQAWTNETVAPLTSPVFNNNVGIINNSSNALLSLQGVGGNTGQVIEDTSGNLQLTNAASNKFNVRAQAGATGTIQDTINGTQVEATTLTGKTVNVHPSWAWGTPTCGTGCSSISGTNNVFAVTTSAGVTSITVNFPTNFPGNPVCTITASTGVYAYLPSVSVSAITIFTSAAITGTLYGHCF